MTSRIDSRRMRRSGPDTSKLPPNFPNVNRRPPSIPVGIGSKLYPREDLHLTKDLPVETQMRVAFLRRKNNEVKHYYAQKHPDYREFREDNCHLPNYCNICSEFYHRSRRGLAVVTHQHQSSLNYRIHADSNPSPWGEYFCSTCEIGFHGYKTGSRYPVLVTSSMLLNWQGIRSRNGYQGDKIHVDQIGISGAKIRDLEFAYLAEYAVIHRPCDVLLVSGYNNILRGHSPKDIMADIRHFKGEVLKNPGSSFAVATIPLPPCMSKLPEDLYKLTRPDMTERIVDLNDEIMQLNREPGQAMEVHRAPCYHSWGLRSKKLPREVGPRNLLEAMTSHSHQDWREARPIDQLHLSDDVRLRMGKAAIKYFCSLYEIEA